MPGELARVNLDHRSEELLKRLEKADLMPELKYAMRSSTNGIVPRIKRAIKGLPSNQAEHNKGSLRDDVARSVKRSVRVSPREVFVAVLVKPHGGKSNLARVLEGAIPWRHPVYGRAGTDVGQSPSPYFYDTIEKQRREVEKEILGVFRRFERELLCLTSESKTALHVISGTSGISGEPT